MKSPTLAFSFLKDVPQEISNLLELEYDKYERAHGVHCGFEPFTLVAEENGSVVGILTGNTAFSEIYVDDLLVLPDYRNRGVGRTLLKQVEVHFQNQNFTNINLVTNEFQAPEFYRKCGYELEFVRKNPKFPKLTKYFFIKWLS